MINRWYETIPQFPHTNRRKCYVYLPTMYMSQPNRRFPVLYMFDGQNVFHDGDATYGKSWGLGKYLDYTDTPLIVAAAECNTGADNGRLSEYAPYTFNDPEYGAFVGCGNKTMDWFINDFKPKIDMIYRTIPDREHTFIAGSSMGGLMSLYALIEYNDVFSKAGALSPSLEFNEKQLLALLKQKRLHRETSLYMDYGSAEFEYEKHMPAIYRRFCKHLMRKNIFLTSRIVPHGDHSEGSWEKQLPFMIHTLIY